MSKVHFVVQQNVFPRLIYLQRSDVITFKHASLLHTPSPPHVCTCLCTTHEKACVILAGVLVQETMEAMARSQGGAHVSVSKLNNVLMQMRKNCNHPDLIKGAFDGSITYPPSEEIRAQCGKMQLMERMLRSLHKGGHKVLIFSQVQRLQLYVYLALLLLISK